MAKRIAGLVFIAVGIPNARIIEKSGSIPAKADALIQRDYYDTILLLLMIKAKENELTLLFLDASHFVMGCDFLGYIYGKTRKTFPVPPFGIFSLIVKTVAIDVLFNAELEDSFEFSNTP
ncbi:MAG: hypothetical protein LBU13_04965 [Synergistaceae bacterium]|jgi:hypothetical protein|nr:hypothetical protein [Synergistaceae bacterium]